MKTCAACHQNPVTAGHGARYCDACRKNDRHRHRTRRKDQIFTVIDCEGVQTGNRMDLWTISYGREDGSSGSYISSNPREALTWLFGEVAGTYDGLNQAVAAFHFNWDTAVLARCFNPDDMMLVHKATAQKGNLICGTRHKPGDKCQKLYHRWDTKLIEAVITEGGEGDVIAWDSKSGIALATTPRRRFYAELRPEGDMFKGRKILDVHDIGAAFTGGLENVIDTWQPDMTPEMRELIKAGKEARQDGFPGWADEQVCAYSEAECVLGARCARLLVSTIAAVSDVRMDPSRLFGSGSIAGSFYNFHGLSKRVETHEDPVVDLIAILCYFGGLIETPVVGRIVNQPVEEDDFNSAYTFANHKVPCMRAGHGHWHHHQGYKGIIKDAIGYVKVTWAVTTPTTPPFCVHLIGGRVVQPLSCRKQWVTLPEYQAAFAEFGYDVVALEAYWWVPECQCPPPQEWMEGLYYERVKIKAQMKSASPEQWAALNVRQEAIKLILNSCYGKLAQRRPEPGKYTNLHYAAYITGVTRARLRERTWALEAAGNIVVYQHTDGLKYIGKARLPVSDRLGDAKHEDQSFDVLIIQPGLLAAKEGKNRCRGIRKDEFGELAWEWAAMCDFTQKPADWPKMEIETRRMLSRRKAIADGKPEQAGIFFQHPMSIGVRDGKRDLHRARPLKGEPEAWLLPPVRAIPEDLIAGIEDIQQYETQLAKRLKAGEFDKERSY